MKEKVEDRKFVQMTLAVLIIQDHEEV